MTRYLAVDHGTKHCGWAVLDDDMLRSFGQLELPGPYPQTLTQLDDEVLILLREFQPDVMVCESPMQLRGGHVAQVLIEHFSILKLEAVTRNLGVREVSPPTMKLHVAGSGHASKDDVAWAVAKRFGLKYDEVAIPVYFAAKKRSHVVRTRLYDTADAVGLGWAAYQMDQETGAKAT